MCIKRIFSAFQAYNFYFCTSKDKVTVNKNVTESRDFARILLLASQQNENTKMTSVFGSWRSVVHKHYSGQLK